MKTHRNIWPVHSNLPVKAARPQEGRVQHIWTVGGSKDDDARVAFKAIHLRKELVDGLLSLIIATSHTCTAQEHPSRDNLQSVPYCCEDMSNKVTIRNPGFFGVLSSHKDDVM